MNTLVVLTGGFLTTVQDLGRPGHAAIGVSASGAADPIALRVGNRLVGNPATFAGLEMTLVGGSVRFDAAAVVALTGAEANGRVNGRSLPRWRALVVAAGQTLLFGGLAEGARTYLCVRGGLDAPRWLGSASTHLATGLGGLEGRALRAGDRIPVGAEPQLAACDRPIDPAAITGYHAGEPFRVTEGTQASWFTESARATLASASWRVAESCDRMGIRLEGPALDLLSPHELVTEGVVLGAIQVPADGLPIVLFIEHQTTGGYPKIAGVIAADASRLGQLRPRDTIRFTAVSFEEALARYHAQESELRELLA